MGMTSDAGIVELLDETRSYPHSARLVSVVEAYMREVGLGDRELTVVLMDDDTIARHNLQDREVEGPTDVLSYPTFEPDDDVGFPQVPHLGDVFVSLDTAGRQAEEHGHDLLSEVLVLVAHGLTHLRGYDHQADDEWPPFTEAQARVLELLRSGA